MKLEWLGESRPLMETLFQWSNRYAAVWKKPFPITDQVSLSFSEMQVVEYLLENEELQLNMAGIARRLGISPATFSGHVSKLEKMGLVQKYYHGDNRKDLIVLVTDQGRDVYAAYSRWLYEVWYDALQTLNAIPTEYRDLFSQAIGSMSHEENEKGRPVEQLRPVKEK